MALKPYTQTTSLSPLPGPARMADTRVVDLGPSIARVGQQILSTFEPVLKDKALKQARRDAGEVVLTRDEAGNLVLPQAPEDGGRVYAAAFEELAQARYLNDVGSSFQQFLDEDMAERRVGNKPFDAADYSNTVDARIEGVVAGVDPMVRPQVEQILMREGLERKRAFVNEWSRTQRQQLINGANDQIRFHLNEAAAFRDRGMSLEEVTQKHIGPMLETVDKLRNIGMIGDLEADALFMQKNVLTDGIVRYADSLETATKLIPAIGGLGLEDVQRLRYALDGFVTEGDALSGLVYEEAGNEVVTPASLRATFVAEFGFDPTSVERGPEHALSKKNPSSLHNTVNGGRAIDSPRIPGMTFEEYVARWKALGFEVVQAIDEYKKPSAWATGKHWHIALGNMRATKKEVELDGLKDISLEEISQLDPQVRADLKTILTDREQVIRAEAAEARQLAAQEARAAEERRQHAELVDSINGANSAGVGGNWTSQQKGALDAAFSASVNVQNLGDEAERAKALGFVQQNNYLPGPMVNYMENMIRSPQWQGALQFYQGLGDATMGNGARVGDMLLGELDSRSAALLREADRMGSAGISSEVIEARLERLRSKEGFTSKDAQSAYNKVMAGKEGRGYSVDRDTLIRNHYGLSKTAAIAPGIRADVDAAYAANLDIADREPERALRMSIQQVAGRQAKSGIFRSGHGPVGLVNTYSAQQIQNFLQQETSMDGEPLLPKIGGKRPVVGRSIKLEPLDTNRTGIGRYAVYIYAPDNPSNLIDAFEIDLGREMAEWSKGQGQGVSIDPIAIAREKRGSTEKFLKNIGRYGDKPGR